MDSFVSSEPRSTPGVSSEPALSLEAILSSDTTLAWDEAVSIVEALCEAVQGSVLRTIPGAKEIFLTGTGTVAVRSGAGTPEPVEAGRRLVELLGKATVPAPLRLFASQAVRAEQHPSIVEFQQGLNYFAKSGGRERIVAVYERCSRELAAMPFPSEGETKSGKALDKAEPADERGTKRRLGREALLVGGAIVVIVSVLSCAYLAWPKLSRPSADPEAVPAVQAEAAVSTKRPAGRRAETRTRATAAGTPAPQPAPAAPGEAAGSSGSVITPRRDPLDLEIIGAQPAASSLQESADSGGSSTSEPEDVAPPASDTPLFVQDGPAELVDLDRVYSAADAAVVPATLSREQLLPPPMGVLEGVEPLRIELVVSADGTVERARFLVPPRRMPDMMLLSSAKTWTFNPALKDGRPVRSRVVLSWFVAP